MGRNLDRRVETIVPVIDPAIRDCIRNDIIDVLERDNCKTRWLRSDGSYVRRPVVEGEPLFCAQTEMLEMAAKSEASDVN
jgi:polyphosphate kinase